MKILVLLLNLHARAFGQLQTALDGWFLGLCARIVFAGVLLSYFLGSALTKIGEGRFGFLTLSDSAYVQILPGVFDAYAYDASQIPFLPWGLIVHLGTFGEFVLPVLLTLGLCTRLAAAGMIVFVIVQSYVDIAAHGVDDMAIGRWFDQDQGATIFDQRALWMFLLLYLLIKGAGSISLDGAIAGLHRRSRDSRAAKSSAEATA